ncbi:MAG: N-6 DNA methylase [Chloroflexi bacterium]|nr:N-6 DNA methylase [Chloroflexota bacterium]
MTMAGGATTTFATVQSEGGVLPHDLLVQIARRSDALPGLADADFGLEPGTRVDDAIQDAWAVARPQWASFSTGWERYPKQRLQYLRRAITVLCEVLGYATVDDAPASLDPAARGRISHRADGVPLLLVASTDLDAAERGRRSAFAEMQAFLNAGEDLWGIVTNGRTLRVVRDQTSASRVAYLEFDLAQMFTTGASAEFGLLWLLLHRSRLPQPGAPADACLLERWRVEAAAQGARALHELRGGVREAIAALGQGFLEHPANAALRERLSSGALEPLGYYRQLLRLVYRLIFLFAAEERDLLLPESATPRQRTIYRRYYSASRLRERPPVARHDHHSDLWASLQQLFGQLAGTAAPSPLGVQPLGGLFAASDIPDLELAQLENRALLAAVAGLGTVGAGRTLRRVNYRDMGVEELGSVYEGLLDEQPALAGSGAHRRFELTSSGERKSSGSYYTPPSLVAELVRTTLTPRLAAIMAAPGGWPERRERLLALTVCDPACGSGHFLLAAARSIAHEVARCAASGSEPSLAQQRAARRETISRCIFGVDLNALAVDLCRMALWLEGHVPGLPMAFLEDRIRPGNALLGARRTCLDQGIPDEAFTAVSGDDPAVATSARRANRAQRAGAHQVPLPLDWPAPPAPPDAAPAARLADVAAQEQSWRRGRATPAAQQAWLSADLWAAAFLWPLTPQAPPPPTLALWRRLSGDEALAATLAQHAALPDGLPHAPTIMQARALARQFQLFHWELEFPQVFAGAAPGFDVVLGNPPWERVELREQEFFARIDPAIAEAPNAAERKRRIAALADAPDAPARQHYLRYRQALRHAEHTSNFLRLSGRFPLTSSGASNLYSAFAELMHGLVRPGGRVGLIAPSGIATDHSNRHFFTALVGRGRIERLYDFENARPLFVGVHRSFKFTLLTLRGSDAPADGFEAAFFLHQPEELRDPQRTVRLTAAEIALLNPNSRTCPVFRSRADAELTLRCYRELPVLVRDAADGQAGLNPWHVTFQSMFDMSGDSGLFRTRARLLAAGAQAGADGRLVTGAQRWLPLLEAKLVHQYDHRFASYDDAGATTRPLDDAEHADPDAVPQPRYWVDAAEVEARLADRWPHGWLLGFRDIARATDRRTAICSIFPRYGVSGVNIVHITRDSENAASDACMVYANANSFIFDYIARQKIGSTHLNQMYLKQLPVIPPERYGITSGRSASDKPLSPPLPAYCAG